MTRAGPGNEPARGAEVLFTTARLVVPARWLPAHLAAYAALNADLAVMEHLGGAALTRQQSDEFAAYGQDRYDLDGLGLLPVVRATDATFLGMCGLHRHRWYPDDVEVGWRFARTAWGHGYATEAAAGWLARAFGPLGLPRVVSITTPANARSRAVMARLGMLLDHEATHLDRAGRPVDVVVCALTAEQWRRSAGSGPEPGPR